MQLPKCSDFLGYDLLCVCVCPGWRRDVSSTRAMDEEVEETEHAHLDFTPNLELHAKTIGKVGEAHYAENLLPLELLRTESSLPPMPVTLRAGAGWTEEKEEEEEEEATGGKDKAETVVATDTGATTEETESACHLLLVVVGVMLLVMAMVMMLLTIVMMLMMLGTGMLLLMIVATLLMTFPYVHTRKPKPIMPEMPGKKKRRRKLVKKSWWSVDRQNRRPPPLVHFQKQMGNFCELGRQKTSKKKKPLTLPHILHQF